MTKIEVLGYKPTLITSAFRVMFVPAERERPQKGIPGDEV
jgi:hypothetical protein